MNTQNKLFIRKKEKMKISATVPKKKTPIGRNSKFFSPKDAEIQIHYMQEYLEEFANQTIILYQVDFDKTKVDDLYKESKKDAVRFKTPVELPVVYEIAKSEMKSYNSQTMKGIYSKPGKLTFTVLIRTLEEKNCDINRGDYIGVQLDTDHREYWTVTDDGRVNAMSNGFTLYGTTAQYRTVECAYVDPNEFKDR